MTENFQNVAKIYYKIHKNGSSLNPHCVKLNLRQDFKLAKNEAEDYIYYTQCIVVQGILPKMTKPCMFCEYMYIHVLHTIHVQLHIHVHGISYTPL